jgi:hypothetical protein
LFRPHTYIQLFSTTFSASAFLWFKLCHQLVFFHQSFCQTGYPLLCVFVYFIVYHPKFHVFPNNFILNPFNTVQPLTVLKFVISTEYILLIPLLYLYNGTAKFESAIESCSCARHKGMGKVPAQLHSFLTWRVVSCKADRFIPVKAAPLTRWIESRCPHKPPESFVAQSLYSMRFPPSLHSVYKVLLTIKHSQSKLLSLLFKPSSYVHATSLPM